MMRVLLIGLFCLLTARTFAQNISKKESELNVTLKNASFNTLALLDYRDQHNLIIKGKKIGDFKWEITVPDSILSNSEYMMLIVPDKDTLANAYRSIRFTREFEDKTTQITNIGLQGKVNYINGEFTGATLYEKENISSFLSIIDSNIIGNVITDDFKLSIHSDSSDITIRSLEPNYAWFTNFYNKQKLSYTENLNLYIDLARKHPNSRYLITYLALNLPQFKNRKDIIAVYKHFSEKQKNSKWSDRIERFLSDDSKNIRLPNLALDRNEPIVQDSTKYNLIIFSASWCVPCIEEIPLLKKLYNEFKSKVHFTFISMDKEKDLAAFQKILVKYHIPWRTLYAYKDLDRVTDLFMVKAIPHSIFIYPNGRQEVMDVRKEENQKKIRSQLVNVQRKN